MKCLFWIYTVLLNVRYLESADPYGKPIVVVAEIDSNVTLKLWKENVEDVTWISKDTHIASTEPHKPINVSKPYVGKLASEQDGSLIILNLQNEDEGTYDASIKLLTGDTCTAQYQLHVYQRLSGDDIKISHNVFSQTPCGVTLTCTANGPDVNITWTCEDLTVTSNVVNVTDPETQYICTALNPVSDISKSITPSKYCEKGNNSWIGILILAGIFITTVMFWLLYRRGRRS